MKRIATALLLALCTESMNVVSVARGASAEMRASKSEVKQEIVAVIEAQLTAFRKGELEKAYGYAAADLRAQKSLRTFTTIVQGNYPEIWASTRAEFGIVRDDGTRATVTVQVYSKTASRATNRKRRGKCNCQKPEARCQRSDI